MNYKNYSAIQLKFSIFNIDTPILNDNTLFLISGTSQKTHDLYLLLYFIISKYNDLIFKNSSRSYYLSITNYIEVFNDFCNLDKITTNHMVIALYSHFVDRFYSRDYIIPCETIEKHFDVNNMSNIIIDKHSHFSNKYVCFKTE